MRYSLGLGIWHWLGEDFGPFFTSFSELYLLLMTFPCLNFPWQLLWSDCFWPSRTPALCAGPSCRFSVCGAMMGILWKAYLIPFLSFANRTIKERLLTLLFLRRITSKKDQFTVRTFPKACRTLKSQYRCSFSRKAEIYGFDGEVLRSWFPKNANLWGPDDCPDK